MKLKKLLSAVAATAMAASAFAGLAVTASAATVSDLTPIPNTVNEIELTETINPNSLSTSGYILAGSSGSDNSSSRTIKIDGNQKSLNAYHVKTEPASETMGARMFAFRPNAACTVNIYGTVNGDRTLKAFVDGNTYTSTVVSDNNNNHTLVSIPYSSTEANSGKTIFVGANGKDLYVGLIKITWGEPEEQNVTLVNNDEYGTATIDTRSAEPGDTITVTASAKVGYEIKSVTYTTNLSNDPVGLDLDADGKYTFTMPEGATIATVTVNYIEAVKHSISLSENVTSDYSEAAARQAVTLTVTPEAGKELRSIKVTGDTTNIAVPVTADMVFTMPNDDVTVNAVFADEKDGTVYEGVIPAAGEEVAAGKALIDEANIVKAWVTSGVVSAETIDNNFDTSKPNLPFRATGMTYNGTKLDTLEGALPYTDANNVVYTNLAVNAYTDGKLTVNIGVNNNKEVRIWDNTAAEMVYENVLYKKGLFAFSAELEKDHDYLVYVSGSGAALQGVSFKAYAQEEDLTAVETELVGTYTDGTGDPAAAFSTGVTGTGTLTDVIWTVTIGENVTKISQKNDSDAETPIVSPDGGTVYYGMVVTGTSEQISAIDAAKENIDTILSIELN